MRPNVSLPTKGQWSGDPWEELYTPLHAHARYLVNYFKVPSWQGQEYDIADDIVQEAMSRLFVRSLKAERGEAPPIQSLYQMLVTVAYNYHRDLKRHDRRIVHMPFNQDSLKHPADSGSLLDVAVEQVYREQIFTFLAHAIRAFPEKQRKALLTDLANQMCFDAQPTPLQSAFLQEGIQLKEYQRELPQDPRERSRHISLLSHAYKRVARLRNLPRA